MEFIYTVSAKITAGESVSWSLDKFKKVIPVGAKVEKAELIDGTPWLGYPGACVRLVLSGANEDLLFNQAYSMEGTFGSSIYDLIDFGQVNDVKNQRKFMFLLMAIIIFVGGLALR